MGVFIDRRYRPDQYEKPVWPVFTDRKKSSPKMNFLLLRNDLMRKRDK
jgi:hypothetical protein